MEFAYDLDVSISEANKARVTRKRLRCCFYKNQWETWNKWVIYEPV